MALTEITYTGDGTDVTFGPIPFDYLEATDVKVSLNGVITSAFTIDPSTKIITFSSAPGNGVSIRVFRRTDFEDLSATFISGSAIRAQDLNDTLTRTYTLPKRSLTTPLPTMVLWLWKVILIWVTIGSLILRHLRPMTMLSTNYMLIAVLVL